MSDLPPPPPPPGRPGYPAGPPVAPPGGSPPAPPPSAPSSSWTPDEEPRAPRGRRVSIVLAIGAVLALLAATIVVITRDGDDPQPAAAPSTTAPAGGEDDEPPANPTTTEPAGPPLSQDELEVLVEELQAFVADARGLEFLEPVEVELADGDAFQSRLLEDFEEDADQIADVEVFYKALGLLDPGADLLEELRAIYSAGVLGFYDPETNELVVRGTSLTPYVRKTIVHELVHALDDQHFELDREEYEDRKDEIATGFTAVVEGNARRIEQLWIDEQPDDVQDQAAAEERAFADGIDVDAFPEILLFEIGAPYELGKIFVDAIVAERGDRAVDAALEDPPTTSEQVLFPPLYSERQPRVEVPPPPADGEIVDDGVVGTLFWFGLFTTGDTTVPPQDAFAAIQGWGGDWAVTWMDGDAACARIDVVGDTQQDTDELEDALRAWAEGSGAAEITVVDERVRVDSCVAGAGAVPPQV
ncbi:MAG TPA: hypothetical protein VLR27_12260 [Acidimicrobiales bacterium]|nr:hypothetical protein [Acidimicrobiales bacterium]